MYFYFQKKECIDNEHTYSRLKSDHSILSSPGKRNKLARKPLRELAGNPETSSNEPPAVRLSESATGSKGQQSWKSSPTLQWKQNKDKVTGKKFTYINRSLCTYVTCLLLDNSSHVLLLNPFSDKWSPEWWQFQR